MDIYDGDSGPVIYHGKTLTSKVSLRDICQAIAKYAFVTSPYPLVISAEVHCGVEQQDMIAEIMMECFGSDLIQAPIDGIATIKVLPSPEQLRGKYLLKVRHIISFVNFFIRPLGKESLCGRAARGRTGRTPR